MAKTISTVSSTSGPFTYSNYVLESYNSGAAIPVVVEKDTVLDVVIDKKTASNVKLITALQNAYKSNNRTALLSLIRDKNSVFTNGGNLFFRLGDVVKPVKEYPELGYIGEAIIQSAMYARFLSKDKAVVRKDIENILNEVLYVDKHLVKNSPNFPSNGVAVPDDIISSTFELASKYVDWLKKANKKYYEYPYNILDNFFRDAVNFANSEQVFSHAKQFYYNGQQDKISIEGTGISGQNVTKADIKVYYYEGFNRKLGVQGTKKEINLRVSAKIKNITQFGQLSGLTFEKQKELFDLLLNVNIDPIEKQFRSIVKSAADLTNSNTRLNAWSLTYKYGTDLFNRSNNKVKDLVRGIKYFMTLNENTVGGVYLMVVSIGSGLSITETNNLTEEKFKQYLKKNKLTEKDIRAEFYTTGAGRQINIMIGDKPLLNLSARYTANRSANYISGKDVLYEILKGK